MFEQHERGWGRNTGNTRRPLTLWSMVAIAVLHGPAALGAEHFVSARYVSGRLPDAPVQAVSGGEVFLEVLVAVDGRVDSIRTLRTTSPFTDVAIAAVRGWWFEPATEDVASDHSGVRVAAVTAPVLVAAMFTPPSLNGPTLGQPPQDVLSASDETSSPRVAETAGYPPRALGSGTVLIELTIDGSGAPTDAQVRVSSPAFDAAALAAARSWSFRPAQRHGSPVTTRAYLLFAFRQPVIGP